MSIIGTDGLGGGSYSSERAYAYIRAYTADPDFYGQGVVAYADGKAISLSAFSNTGEAYIPIRVNGTYTVKAELGTGETVALGTAVVAKRGECIDIEVETSSTITITVKKSNISDEYLAGTYRIYNGDTEYATGSLSTSGPTKVVGIPKDASNVDVIYNSVSKTYSLADNVTSISDTWQLIKPFSSTTDAELVQIVSDLDKGITTTSDLPWAVGDSRTINGQAWVIQNIGGKTFTTGKPVHYIVGMKHCLSTKQQMNSSDTNSGSWEGSAMRTYCNGTFRNSIPEAIRGIFKQFNTVTAQTYNGSTNQTSKDYFALPAMKELGLDYQYENTTEKNALSTFTWYNTSANRIKKIGDSGSADWYWSRSPYSSDSGRFCSVASDGTADGDHYASGTRGVSPFGCI